LTEESDLFPIKQYYLDNDTFELSFIQWRKDIKATEVKRQLVVDRIFALFDYYPSRDRYRITGDSLEFSERIRRFKSYNGDTDYYYFKTRKSFQDDVKSIEEELVRWIDDNYELFFCEKNVLLTVIPGHEVKLDNSDCVCAYLAFKIARRYGFDYSSNLILRIKDNGAKALAATYGYPRPRFSDDLDSMKINEKYDLSDTTVFVLDDITTVGDTFEAVRYLLKKAGAKEVITLALGKTVNN